MRKLFVTFCLIIFSQAFILAQGEATRTLSFYLDSFSGHLTETPTGQNRLFNGNEFEFGAIYSQNFARAPWFSLYIKTLIVTGQNSTYDDNGTPDITGGDYIGNSGTGDRLPNFIQDFGTPRVQVGINLGGYAIIAMDTRGLIANENYYTVRLNNRTSLTFVSILEFWAVPLLPNDNPDTVQILELFSLRVDYVTKLLDNLTFASKLAARFNGFSFSDPHTGPLTAEQFRKNFTLRWENQLIWNVTPAFYMWTQLRYNVENLARGNPDIVDNQLALQAGLGYYFNI